MDGPILVTGATGNVGAATVSALVARGVAVRAAARDVSRASFPSEVEPVRLDFEDSSTFGPAVAGGASAFVIRPPQIARVARTVNALIDAAAAAGVAHLTVLSVMGAGRNRFVPHRRVEDRARQTGLGHTMLRPGFFCQNIVDAYGEDIRRDARLYVPAGAGTVAWVDARDVGEVAALTLTEPGHHGRAYTLTGPRADSFADVARTLSALRSRAVRYEPASAVGYLRHLVARRRLEPSRAVVQSALHVGLRGGHTPDPTLERLLGRRPRTVADYLTDHLDELA